MHLTSEIDDYARELELGMPSVIRTRGAVTFRHLFEAAVEEND